MQAGGGLLPLREVGGPLALTHNRPARDLAGDLGGKGVALVVLAVDAKEGAGALAAQAVVGALAIVLGVGGWWVDGMGGEGWMDERRAEAGCIWVRHTHLSLSPPFF